MKKGSSWEFDSCSASQGIPGVLWNLKVHYCAHNYLAICPNSEPDESSPHPHNLFP
jgi:hypothetical protein